MELPLDFTYSFGFNLVDLGIFVFIFFIILFLVFLVTFIGYGIKLRQIRDSLNNIAEILKSKSLENL